MQYKKTHKSHNNKSSHPNDTEWWSITSMKLNERVNTDVVVSIVIPSPYMLNCHWLKAGHMTSNRHKYYIIDVMFLENINDADS